MTKPDPQLFITALRVLAKSIHNERIAPQEVHILRGGAMLDEVDLPLDELCCRLVRRALGDPGRKLPTNSQN